MSDDKQAPPPTLREAAQAVGFSMEDTINLRAALAAGDGLYSGLRPFMRGQVVTRALVPFQYLIAELVSMPHPVVPDADPSYVRVRLDLFNRLCASVQGMEEMQVPPEKAEGLQWPEIDDQGDDWLGDDGTRDEIASESGAALAGEPVEQPGQAGEPDAEGGDPEEG